MRLRFLRDAMRCEARSVQPWLVQPEELEVLVAAHLQDVVRVARLDADDVARLDVPLLAGVQMLSALFIRKNPLGRRLAPVWLGPLPETSFASSFTVLKNPCPRVGRMAPVPKTQP
jgi:hypothetical protein